LRACALAFARLADPSALPGPRREAARRIARAMSACPEMVAGEGRLDTNLMRALRGDAVSKGGAEGYQGLALVSRGLGVAVKISDGNNERGCGPVVIETLRQLGAIDAAALAEVRQQHRWSVENHRGLPVGEVRPAFNLAFV